MVLRPTQALTETIVRNISWEGKGGRCGGLKTLPSSCASCLEIRGARTVWSRKVLPSPVMGQLCFPHENSVCIFCFPYTGLMPSNLRIFYLLTLIIFGEW